MAFWLNEKVDTDQLAGRSARGLSVQGRPAAEVEIYGRRRRRQVI